MQQLCTVSTRYIGVLSDLEVHPQYWKCAGCIGGTGAAEDEGHISWRHCYL